MTTTAAGNPLARHWARRGLGGLVSAAVAASGLVALGVAAAPSASAAPISVTNASFTWDLNKEATAGAYAPGTWNLMSAGKIGDPGAGGQTLGTDGATWSNGVTAGWKATDGNVTVEDKQADGSYAPATFAGTRTNSAGVNNNTANPGVQSETRLAFGQGVGTLDPVADDASITWDGDATILFYSGMTYFTLSDPKLTLTGGTGTVTATLGGYATSMEDSTQWQAVPDETVTVASISGVDVTATGLTATPAYHQVTYDAGDSTPQVTTGENWGSFPQAFVDFQQKLGAGSYWYSSGGSADVRKVANPLSVAYSEYPQAQVVVSDTTLLPSGAHEITVTGTGFDPAWATGTRAPLAGKPSGVYVAFGKYAEAWKPSDGAASANRKNSAALKWAVSAADMETIGGAAAGAIELTPAGTFSTTLIVDKAAMDAAATAANLVNYGIYTYAGGGAVQAAYETYTPITFATVKPTVALTTANVSYGTDATATVTVASDAGDTGAVTLATGTTPLGTADLVAGTATFALGRLAAGSYPLTASYAGATNVEAGTATATLVVSKAGSATDVKVTKKPRRKKAGKATATVASPSGVVTGATRAVLKDARGKTVRGVKAGSVTNGRATLKLPKLARGTYTLAVTFIGDANVEKSKDSVRFKVS